MSQENVDVLRRLVAAWNAGDMDTIRSLHDPDAVMYAPEGWPEPGPEIGRDAVIRQYERIREAWERDSVELITDYIAAGDRVAMRFVWDTSGHGPGSRWEFTHVATLRDGRIVRSEYHWDYAEALRAAGLAGHEVR